MKVVDASEHRWKNITRQSCQYLNICSSEPRACNGYSRRPLSRRYAETGIPQTARSSQTKAVIPSFAESATKIYEANAKVLVFFDRAGWAKCLRPGKTCTSTTAKQLSTLTCRLLFGLWGGFLFSLLEKVFKSTPKSRERTLSQHMFNSKTTFFNRFSSEHLFSYHHDFVAQAPVDALHRCHGSCPAAGWVSEKAWQSGSKLKGAERLQILCLKCQHIIGFQGLTCKANASTVEHPSGYWSEKLLPLRKMIDVHMN